jgi:drug/metabolite transporter (DMT)-like permease
LIVRPGTDGFDRWAILGLLSVAFVVLRDVSVRRMGAALPSATIALASAVAVTLMAAAVAPFQGFAPVSGRAALLVAGAAGFLVLGYLTIVSATRTGDIGFVAPFRYSALIFAILFGWIGFGTLPDPLTLAGAGIVVTAGLYTFHRERLLIRAARRGA